MIDTNLQVILLKLVGFIILKTVQKFITNKTYNNFTHRLMKVKGRCSAWKSVVC